MTWNENVKNFTCKSKWFTLTWFYMVWNDYFTFTCATLFIVTYEATKFILHMCH
jgi:hypothetical protein